MGRFLHEKTDPIKYINYENTEDTIKVNFSLNESLIGEDVITVCLNNVKDTSEFKKRQ